MALHILGTCKSKIDKFEDNFAFLSNFYECEIEYEGIKYPTNEHAFQAAKTFDIEKRKEIAKAKTPGIAKRMGRQVELRKDWEQVKDQVMLDCIRAKFSTGIMKQKLISTAPYTLVEGNSWHDNCWGNCTCDKCRRKEGENRLGKILMKVREEILKEENAKEKIKLLVVVDMQNDFVTGSLGTKEAQAIVPNVVKKVKEYSDNGDMIVFTKDTHPEHYLETTEGKKLPVKHCIEGTWGWEIIPELKLWHIPNNHYNNGNTFIKTTFGSTGLANYISDIEGKFFVEDNVFEVEFIGLCTDICVVSNVLLAKAFSPNIKITVDASCCAGVTPESHKSAIETMKMCQIDIVGE